MYEKPLPGIDNESRPYWEGAKQHKLLIQKCKDCGHHQHYPRALCTDCGSDAVELVEASGKGEIYTYTIARRTGPAFADDVPYVPVIVQLEEGPKMISWVVTDDVDSVAIGQKVTVIFDDVTDEVTLPKFTQA